MYPHQQVKLKTETKKQGKHNKLKMSKKKSLTSYDFDIKYKTLTSPYHYKMC